MATVTAPLELWVDVLPSKGFPEVSNPVDDWMRPALDIATKLAGADWRCLEYNRGKGYLFAALQQHAATAGVPSGVVMIRTSMMGWEVVEEFLTPFSIRVVRGVASR